MAVLLLGAPGFAFQRGYSTEKHPELGMSFPRARGYEAIPVQQTESWVVLRCAEKGSSRRIRKAIRPEIRFVWIDWVADPPSEGSEAPPPPSAEEDGRSRSVPYIDDAKERAPPINSLQRCLTQELPGWELGGRIEQKDRDG